MKTSTSFTKSPAQIQVENILHTIKEKGLNISKIENLPEYSTVYQEFKDSLAELIYNICHEYATYSTISSITKAYPSQYLEDMKEWDTLLEIINTAYLGLWSVIKKGPDKGRVRIDTFNPDVFTYTVRAYIQNNIIQDCFARKYGRDSKHTESDTVVIEGDEIYKADSVKYNRFQIENNSFNDQVLDSISFPDDLRQLVISVIKRFEARKPVAAYLFLRILDESYEPMTLVQELKETTDFNHLFHKVLNKLNKDYNLNINCYDSTIYKADKWLDSFKSISDDRARDRLDRLCSQTRHDIQKLPVANVIRSHM